VRLKGFSRKPYQDSYTFREPAGLVAR
jgi:hypothetical protein